MTVVLLDPAARLKKRIREHLRKLGYKRGRLEMGDMSKEVYRAVHEPQRADKLARNRKFIAERGGDLLFHFANGSDIIPEAITPRLELISGQTWQSDLFRFATLQWRIPVSDGYGRRMRFLVWDDSNDKLIGLIALGDAVFNLAVRDSLIGWDHHDRSQRLSSIMDAYILGAVAPYNSLLCGKLVASLIRTQEMRNYFEERYDDSVGIISGQRKHPRLAMVTTTSALGRSSVYNRLKLDGVDYFKSIGYTSGWGHFHISDSLFQEIRDYLGDQNDSYADGHGFGTGPNWRLRTIRKALRMLGMNDEIMKHRLVREVFVCELATNAHSFLRGESTRARFGPQLLSHQEVCERALTRWVIPRSERIQEYQSFNRNDLLKTLQIERSLTVMRNAARA